MSFLCLRLHLVSPGLTKISETHGASIGASLQGKTGFWYPKSLKSLLKPRIQAPGCFMVDAQEVVLDLVLHADAQ